MKRVRLICNAHLDPVWLWRWQEGCTEALSTFRTAEAFTFLRKAKEIPLKENTMLSVIK